MTTLQHKKITFEEAWESSSVFFVDKELETEIDTLVEGLLRLAEIAPQVNQSADIMDDFVHFIQTEILGLEFVLKEIELSEEKFLRIISLLRRIGRIPGGFESEWSIEKIRTKVNRETEFAKFIGNLLLDGKRDQSLTEYIPKYYLETLNYREISQSSLAARQVRYKKSLIGTYAGKKGYKVENKIRQVLLKLQTGWGIPFAQGRSILIDTNIDFAVPSLEDPWVVIMSSFQETTSSGQTTKARDMLSAYERLERINSRNREKRAFVNFVDGGGWLARKRDFQRLVNQCHYFINLHHIDLLEEIILQHLPKKFIKPGV